MGATTKSISQALLESYFAIRKEWWKLVDEEDNLNIPKEDTKEYHKLDVSIRMLNKINTGSYDDFIKIAYDLYQMELDEKALHDDRFWLTRLVVNSPLVLDALRAIRETILKDTNYDILFKLEREKLIQEQKEIETDLVRLRANRSRHGETVIEKRQADLDAVNQKLDAIDPVKAAGYQDEYFKAIKKSDPKAKELEEESFADFVKNVGDRSKRSPDLTNRLLKEWKPKLQAQANEQAAPRPEPTAHQEHSVFAQSNKKVGTRRNNKHRIPITKTPDSDEEEAKYNFRSRHR